MAMILKHEEYMRLVDNANRYRKQRDQLRESLEECLDALVSSAVPAGGCDDKNHIMHAQKLARAALKATENT